MSWYHIDYFNGYWWSVTWYDELNQVHNHDDMPAMIWSKGSDYYYKHGRCHREDGPAIIGTYGGLRWFHDDVEYIPKCEKL